MKPLQLGFRLNNGVKVIGPMAIFSRTLLAWNVACADDINEESLSLFYVHHPRLDLLVMGIGDEGPSPELRQRIFNLTRTRRINVEILPTYQVGHKFKLRRLKMFQNSLVVIFVFLKRLVQHSIF